MDTRVFCVYNVARGALLSSKVTVADGANQPLTILQVLVGGLAIDSKSGLWISPLHGPPSVPRLFPFDLLYLDEELRVLELAEFVPGVEFPPYSKEVASALILPSQSLQSTQTARDDRLLICPAEEMERQIGVFGTGSSFPARTNPFANEGPVRSPIPQFEPAPKSPSGARFAASMKTGAAAAVAEEVLASATRDRLAERGAGPSIRRKWPLTPALTANDPIPEVATPAPQPQKMEQAHAIKDQAQVPKSVLAAIKIESVAETVVEKAAEASSSTEASSTSHSDAPVISITEVILERPRAVEPPIIVGVHGESVQGDIDDLFSNWMDAPSLASTWKARSAEPVRQPIKPPTAPQLMDTASAEASPAVASPHKSEATSLVAPDAQVETVDTEAQIKPAVIEKSISQPELSPLPTMQADAAPASGKTPDDAVPVQAGPALFKAEPESLKPESHTLEIKPGLPETDSSQIATTPVSTSARVAVPKPAQASTSTVAHYGLWRASLPTAVLPVAVPKEPAEERPGAVVPSAPTEEVTKTAPVTPKASPPKASASSQAADLPSSAAPTPRVAAAVQSPAPPPPPVAKDTQPAPRRAPVEIAKPSVAKTAEAVSRRPLIPDNFVNADERRKPVNKAATSATAGRSAAEDLVRRSVERTPVDRSSVPTREVATEVVDIVQRKLGIGQAKVPDEPASAEAAKLEALKGPKTASAEIIEPPKIVAATELVTGKEPTLSSGISQLAPPDTGIATQNGISKAPAPRVEANGKASAPARTLTERFKRWLNPEAKENSDRRRAHRRYVPGMVAHYYTGGAPKPHDIADISMTGFYLLTEDRWMPDTMIQMTLQKPCAKGERKQSITVLSKIVRRGSDGVAAQFVMAESLDPHSHDVQPSQTTDRFALARFI